MQRATIVMQLKGKEGQGSKRKGREEEVMVLYEIITKKRSNIREKGGRALYGQGRVK